MNNRTFTITKFLFIFFAITYASCSDGLQGDIPECLEDEFDLLKNNACDSGASLKLYQFQGANAYLFDIGHCVIDGASNVYDENCELLGVLGTIAGNIGINGEIFYENATDEVVLWSN